MRIEFTKEEISSVTKMLKKKGLDNSKKDSGNGYLFFYNQDGQVEVEKLNTGFVVTVYRTNANFGYLDKTGTFVIKNTDSNSLYDLVKKSIKKI